MILSTYGEDRYAAGEDDVVIGTRLTYTGDQPHGIIYCHGGLDTAASAFGKTAQHRLMAAAARHATVHVGDLGGDTFGNDTGTDQVESQVAYARATWGVVGPLGFIGTSMGFITATNYALLHPDDVAFIAGVIPGIDLADLHTRGTTGTLIDAAYPPAYNDATDGPDHSPIQFADQLPDDLPIHLFTTSNDPLSVPATADAWITARPQDERTDLGALGHTEAAIAASVAPVTAWVQPYILPTPLR